MKRIVAFVSPIDSDEELAEDTYRPRETSNENGSLNSSQMPLPKQEGTVKFEAVLSDAQLKPIVDALLVTQKAEKVAESLISELLQHELERQPENSDGIFSKILANVERELLNQTYRECNQVKIKTAAKLGIDRNTLHKKLQKHGLINFDNE